MNLYFLAYTYGFLCTLGISHLAAYAKRGRLRVGAALGVSAFWPITLPLFAVSSVLVYVDYVTRAEKSLEIWEEVLKKYNIDSVEVTDLKKGSYDPKDRQ